MDERLINHHEQLIIVCDDHMEDQNLLSCLNESGYQLYCTPRRDEALSLLREVDADLIMVDLELSAVEPLALIAEIIRVRPDIPVVVICPPRIEETAVQALKLDVTDYVKKPLTDDRLLFSVRSSLERARLKRENLEYRHRLETANSQLSEQLENVRKDQQAGYLVQQRMLPLTPFEYQHYRFEQHVRPADYLAGDFIDYHQISSSKFVFFLVDVTGHGAASALVTVLIKQLATRSRAYFIRDRHVDIKTAAWMLGWINRSLLEVGLDRHATILLGVLDVRENTLNYSCGGHLPQAIYSTPEETRFLEGRGLPVGLFEGAEYEDHYLELKDEFSIAILSDGILEVIPHEHLVEKEAYLLKMIKRGDNTPARIIKDLDLEKLDHIPDDISVLTVQRLAQHESR